MKVTIDAQGRKIGRVASEAANVLLGKIMPEHFARNMVAHVSVFIVNVGKLDISAKKKETVRHTRYSGFPGGLRQPRLSEIISKKGNSELIRHAVYGMLPKNKLRDRRMKNISIAE